MSVHGPLGATGSNSAFELSALPLRAVSITKRGMLALLGLLLGTLVLAVSAANTDALLPQSVRPVPTWLAGPFGNDGIGLSNGELIAVLVLVFACYALAVSLAARLPARAVLGTIAALHALVLLAPPLLSTDVFSYQAYARMWVSYGANPYLHGPHAIALDPLYPFIGARWVTTPSAYGPVFTLLSAVLAPASIAVSALAFKATAALASIGTVALLWNAARLRGLNPVRTVALFGLNPLVVIYGVGGGHNDLLMLLVVSGGLYAVLAHRERTAGAMIALGTGIKLTAGLLLPFMLAAGPAAGAQRRRRDLVLGAGVGVVMIAAAGTLAFGSGPLHLPAILRSTQSAGDWHSIPGLIAARLGLGGVGHVAGLVLAAGFVGVCGWLLRRVWRGELDWVDAAAWATIAMLVSASSLLPWYVAWLLPLVGLCTDRRLWRWAVIITAVVQLLQLPDYIPHGSSLVGL